MKKSQYILVEKETISAEGKKTLFALCSSEKTELTPRFSLVYEGYISEWSEDRLDLLTKAQRIFIGVFPGGIVFADKTKEEHGDYKRLAFLPYDTLKLAVETDCPEDIAKDISAYALTFKKGDRFAIAGNSTIELGTNA